jgi:hypothetical protein
MEAFSVGRRGKERRVRELVELVRDATRACELEFAGDASPDTFNYRVGCSKIRRSLPSFGPY